MGKAKQNILAKKTSVINKLNVTPNGTLTIGAGFVYYENSSSDFAQVVTTDENGNIQPVILSSTSDYTETTIHRPPTSVTYSNELIAS